LLLATNFSLASNRVRSWSLALATELREAKQWFGNPGFFDRHGPLDG
jgi:hypothetical protein